MRGLGRSLSVPPSKVFCLKIGKICFFFVSLGNKFDIFDYFGEESIWGYVYENEERKNKKDIYYKYLIKVNEQVACKVRSRVGIRSIKDQLQRYSYISGSQVASH